jgi:CheY-like chemotaxis protein
METIDAFATAYPLEILVAENSNTSRLSTKDLLVQLGYLPDEASSDIDILEKAGKKLYDLILMDLRIPYLESVLNLSNPGPTITPIFIAIAGAAPRTFKDISLKARMDGCITGPMDRQELILQLKACSLLAGKCAVKL